VCSAATVVVCVVLSLQVINEAKVPDETMAGVRQLVERYFHNAGIAIDWDHGHDTRATIVLTSTRRMREIDPKQRRVLGVAVTGSRRAYVWIDRIEARVLEIFQLSAAPWVDRPHLVNRTASMAAFMALVMAHEIGHLLLPPDSHSPRGVMSKDITLDGLRRAIDQTLVFSADQSRAMRAVLTSEPRAAFRGH
jgi:hypothetical protein